MILSITLALLFAGLLLVALNNTEIPEIPIYILSGLLLKGFTVLATSQGWVSHAFVETEIMTELALLGLGILVFYSASGTVFDRKRNTSITSFKTALWLSGISFAGFTGLSLFTGFSIYESVLFGVAASIGSTLMDSNLVKEEARKNHVYGWLTEDINLYDDIFGVVVLATLFSIISGIGGLQGLLAAFTVMVVAGVLRDTFSKGLLKITGSENELVLLSGITTLIAMVWITESMGISAIAGIYAAGLILADTELGFMVRERFSAVKDFFTALSFFAVGYLLVIPSYNYLGMTVALVIFSSVLRPLLSSLALRLQGYDLRTGFMASIQSAQISELVLIASILMIPFTGSSIFEALTIAFTASIIISHLVEDWENLIFETLFSDYELDSEKTDLPAELKNHAIIAGYDWKSRGLEKAIDVQAVVVDYDLENIEEAEHQGIPHLLADLNSDRTWEKLNVEKASVIVTAIEDEKLLEKIKGLDTDAEKVLAKEDSEQIHEELREMLSQALN